MVMPLLILLLMFLMYAEIAASIWVKIGLHLVTLFIAAMVVGATVGLYAMIGVAAVVAGAILFVVFRLVYDIPAEFRAEADIAFGLTVSSSSGGSSSSSSSSDSDDDAPATLDNLLRTGSGHRHH